MLLLLLLFTKGIDSRLVQIVLLKNQENVLPLSTSDVKTVAVIGPNSNATVTMQGNYYGVACNLVSPLEGAFILVFRIHHSKRLDTRLV